MKFYIAGRYSRRKELLGYAQKLRDHGHIVTSRWLDGTHEALDSCGSKNDHLAWAGEDLNDIAQADIFLAFTESGGSGRGGRHFEAGFALALGKLIVCFGPKEQTIFYAPHPRFDDFWEAVAYALRGAHKAKNTMISMF